MYNYNVHIIIVECTCRIAFLINSYGAPLAQRACYLVPHSSPFGSDGEINYDYIITNNMTVC